MMSRSLLVDTVVGTLDIEGIQENTVFADELGTGDVWENADFQKKTGPNCIIKYMNIRLQSAIRDVSPSAPCWVEYAVICFENQQAIPTIDSKITAGIGTNTLGEMCKNLYRGHCIWSGAFGVSAELPQVLDLKIKVPDKFCKVKVGQYMMFIWTARTANVTDTTTTVRSMYSHSYKAYV